jgi:HEAT repeat protein
VFVSKAIEGVVERSQVAEAVPAMVLALKSRSRRVRQYACEALGSFGDRSTTVLAEMRNRLDDISIEVRAWAADALLDLGDPAESLVSSMIEGLQKQEKPLLPGESRIQGFCQYLSVPDRYHAARILWRIGKAAMPAKDALLRCQFDESGCVRDMVARALVNLDEPLSRVLPPLVEGLHSPDMSDRERMRIAETMYEIGVPHEDFLPTVVDVLSGSSDFTANSYALKVVESIGRGALSVAPVIERLIRECSERDALRVPAAKVLRRIGATSEIADAVLSSTTDDDEVVNG